VINEQNQKGLKLFCCCIYGPPNGLNGLWLYVA